MSPSMRREWIEMPTGCQMRMKMLCLPPCGGSGLKSFNVPPSLCIRESPSMRREWIEIRKTIQATIRTSSLPPCGGSGLKYYDIEEKKQFALSPSMRREWIEITRRRLGACVRMSPSMRREWIEIFWVIVAQEKAPGLPPCGGSGLKCCACIPYSQDFQSPSMRREWIEILPILQLYRRTHVSLHAEGVD